MERVCLFSPARNPEELHQKDHCGGGQGVLENRAKSGQRILKLRKAKWLAQGHTADRAGSWSQVYSQTRCSFGRIIVSLGWPHWEHTALTSWFSPCDLIWPQQVSSQHIFSSSKFWVPNLWGGQRFKKVLSYCVGEWNVCKNETTCMYKPAIEVPLHSWTAGQWLPISLVLFYFILFYFKCTSFHFLSSIVHFKNVFPFIPNILS